MMNEVEQEIEGQESEQTIIDRVPELKQLNIQPLCPSAISCRQQF
jgi:hypothetical protein